MKKLTFFILVLFCFMTLPACGKADISEYRDEKILITGLTDEDFYITPGDLAEMECISATAHGKTAKAGTVQGYGPTLETFISHYGVSFEHLKSAKFFAADGYTVTLGRVTWEKYDVILSIANGNKPLDEWHQPLRLVIPGGDSGNWTYLIQKIQFTYKDGE